jgi:hypothetical protein
VPQKYSNVERDQNASRDDSVGRSRPELHTPAAMATIAVVFSASALLATIQLPTAAHLNVEELDHVGHVILVRLVFLLRVSRRGEEEEERCYSEA